MLLIPAIDIKDGKCVRLRQGRMDEATEFSSDPIATAQRWVDAGARRLHIVDLDGAIKGAPVNAPVIEEIAQQFPEVEVQTGGGIRDTDTALTYLEAGVKYVIVGTKAVSTPHFVNDLCLEFPNHIIVALDAKDGKVATNGWSKLSHHDAVDMAQRFEDGGVTAVIYTDISRDGMMHGVNIEATARLARAIHIPVIASGGVSRLEDVKALYEVRNDGIEGIIIGRALYEGVIDFARAAAFVKGLLDAG